MWNDEQLLFLLSCELLGLYRFRQSIEHSALLSVVNDPAFAVFDFSEVSMLIEMASVWLSVLVVIAEVQVHGGSIVVWQLIDSAFAIVPKPMVRNFVNLALQVALTGSEGARNTVFEEVTLNLAIKLLEIELASAGLPIESVQV